MDIDIDASLRSLEAGIGLLPAAFIAIGLLGGPTVGWLLYRFVVQPRTSRYRASQIGALWICTGCRSANELASSRCYRCHREFEDSQIELIDPASGGMVTARLLDFEPEFEPDFEPGPIRPGRQAEPHRGIAAIGGRPPVAVGPGKPKAERPGAPLVDRVGPAKGDRVGPAKGDRAGPAKPKVERPAKPKIDRPRRAVAAGRAAPQRTEPTGRTEG